MKVFFSDLDGTLLTSKKTISPATKAAIDTFVNAGNIFVISTGRALSSALALRDHYGLNYPGSFLSAYNGSILYDNSKETVIYKTGIPSELVPDIIALADKYNLHIQSYRDRYIVTRKFNDHVDYYMNKTKMPVIIAQDFFAEIDPVPPKLLAIDIHNPERLYPLRDEVRKKYGSQLNVIFSEPTFCEFISSDAGKGKALLALCNILGVSRENTLAAGDEENDIPMLEAAGTGIAMKNALDEVKASADIVTENDNDHDGLVPLLLGNL